MLRLFLKREHPCSSRVGNIKKNARAFEGVEIDIAYLRNNLLFLISLWRTHEVTKCIEGWVTIHRKP